MTWGQWFLVALFAVVVILQVRLWLFQRQILKGLAEAKAEQRALRAKHDQLGQLLGVKS